ncbi:type II secretion system protein [Pseudoalteromonas sp. SSM20]|uniref:type II secretion system protein n=1 Tax=Pseudoalteromonas sp. SSM20 TaxID=3139394 RepID=UPI003BA89354
MKQQGFSLVELIITLVILGTLAVTVVPKFFTNESFDSFEFRDRSLTILRTMQLRAMQNTSNTMAHKVCINTSQIAPALTNNCANLALNFDYLVVNIPTNSTATRIKTTDSNNVSFNEIEFDDFGRPNLNCVSNCKIDFGDADICISVQGGIYACQ